MGTIDMRTLGSGCVLASEPMAGVASATLAVALPLGSGRDPEKKLGASAMLEEMLARGAGDRSSKELADALDMAGVHRQVSAGARTITMSFTTIGSRIDELLPLVGDMVRRPRLDDPDVEPTRELCMQSLAGLADDPAGMASLDAKARHFPVPLDRTGYGTAEGLAACDRHTLAEHYAAHALPEGTVIAAAGAIEVDALARSLDDVLGDWAGTAAPDALGQGGPRGYAHREDDSNQTHIVLYHDAPPEPDDDSVLERLATSVLSGGMAARLFTEVREKRGLCYSVQASYRPDKEFGVGSAYVGTTPQRAQESLDVLVAELNRINTPAGAVTAEELDRARVGLTSRVVFAGESPAARTGAMIADIRRLGRARTLEELTARIARVTLDDLNSYLARRSLGGLTIQTVGPDPLTPPV